MALGPTKCDYGILTLDETHLTQTFVKGCDYLAGVARRSATKKSDYRHRALLRMRPCRPCNCRPANDGNELAPPHSITSSARASSVGAISRSSARAVGRLMINSNLVACTTGRSAGLAPLRMRPA